MALEDMDPRHQLETSLKQNEILAKQNLKLLGLQKRQQALIKIALDLGDKLNERNAFLLSQLKGAYNEGRKYPYDETGSSFDRWLATKDK